MEAPITTKDTEAKAGNGVVAAVSSMQGWRKEMEVGVFTYVTDIMTQGPRQEVDGRGGAYRTGALSTLKRIAHCRGTSTGHGFRQA